MAANGISTLGTKELKQRAKLALAAADRAAAGNLRAVYEISQLPTKYIGNIVEDNENIGGLIAGRPWILDTYVPLVTDSGDILITDSGDVLIVE